MRYKIKEICGDYYYEEMSIEEATMKAFIEPKGDKVLRSQDDVDAYIRDNLNEKMPLDGPQWRMMLQDYDPTDEDYLPEERKNKGLIIFKAHHCFCDGTSIICFSLALSDDYGREYFVPGKDAAWY